MGAPAIYRWDDDEAPVYYGTWGMFAKLLKAVLVDGYGTKAGAGWTCEFESADDDETVKVFRSDPVEGTGMYYRVDHGPITNQYAFRANIKGYESMTGVDAGLGPWPHYAIGDNSVPRISAGGVDDYIPRPWVIIADNRCFYLFVWMNIPSHASGWDNVRETNASYVWTGFVGDFVSVVPGDSYAACITTEDAAYGYRYFGTLAHNSSDTASYHYCPRYSDGAAPGADESFTFAHTRTGTLCETAGGGNNMPAYPWNGQMIFARPFINDGAANTIRGYFPGLYAPAHNKPLPYLSTFTDDNGKDYLIMPCMSGTVEGQLFIDPSVDFRP